MVKPLRLFTLGVLACSAVLLLAGNCQAQYRGYGRGGYRPFPPNRMPGWDWWRIYPWSPYNYGRNPYNPIRVPYIAPYPVYTPYAMPYGVPYQEPYAAPYVAAYPPADGGLASGGGAAYQGDMAPTPTGPITSPPPGAAEIKLFVPDRFATVWFDGENTSSMGTSRYYVTPELPKGRDFHYDVKAQWNQGGRTVVEERKITVRAGETAVVDFTKPAQGG
jgi:uncharacterized protein (TIGR03000 family)